jgi:ATP-dependent DNA ligase
MAKRADGKYFPGKRTDLWQKVKVRQSCECRIIGYTDGKGDRNATFGALHIAELDESGTLHYRGKVGTGFNDAGINEILKAIKGVKTTKKPQVVGKLLDERISTWLEPDIIAEISYSKLTPDKMFREPVFIRLRPDLMM